MVGYHHDELTFQMNGLVLQWTVHRMTNTRKQAISVCLNWNQIQLSDGLQIVGQSGICLLAIQTQSKRSMGQMLPSLLLTGFMAACTTGSSG